MSPAGIYIHIPFCQRKCGYCDFYSITALEQQPDFLKALLWEIERTADQNSEMFFDTIYIGGGTPTLFSVDQIQQIWKSLHRHFNILEGGEFTIEANPGTVSPNQLKELRALGINRLSIGAQSFHEGDLKFLERIHSVEDIIKSFQHARQAGFSNINLDLMTAFSGQSVNRFKHSLKQTIDLEPEHVSCYSLILEKGTPFYQRLQTGTMKSLSPDESAVFLDVCSEILTAAGYTAYEISNYARGKNLRCRHNLKYWKHSPYLGMGPSAHSFISPIRWKNHRSLTQYIQALFHDQLPVAEEELLSKESLEFEYIFLQLRLKEGLDMREFSQKFSNNFADKYGKNIKRLQAAGMIEQNEHFLRLSQQGWLLADEIASSF